VGPILTGALLSLELSHQTNFFFIAIPGAIAALAIFFVNLNASVDGKKDTVESVTVKSPVMT